jgi:hypothetical protein
MEVATLSIQSTDQAGSQYQDAAKSFVASTSECSSSLGYHSIKTAEEIEGGTSTHPPVPVQHKAASGPKPAMPPPTLQAPPANSGAPLKSDGHKTIAEEFIEMKHNLMNVVQSMERLGIALVKTNQLSAQEASVESVKRSINDILHTNRDYPVRNPTRTRGSRFRGGKSLRTYRKTWSAKVTHANQAFFFVCVKHM